MRRSDVNLVVQIGRATKIRLEREATERGVETSALVRGILGQYFADVGEEVRGWCAEEGVVIQLVRVSQVEILVPVRLGVSRRSRGRP